MYKIPFNRPYAYGKEFEYIQQAIHNMQLSGDGPFTKKCHALMESILGAKKVLLTTSCTHALEMTAMLLDLNPSDEVIVPSFTFVSTANAYVSQGATPVFADVRPDTLNLDETKLRKLITRKTRAIVVVHYAGVACEMDEILKIAGEAEIPVIEDNAHGFMAKYKGRNLGTLGELATQSFHETKNITCGEGGALVINSERFVHRAEIIREKGTNRSLFFRGMVDKYGWVDVGSSYLPSEILAAYLYAQLERRDWIQTQRKRICKVYEAQLREWAAENKVQLPTVPEYSEQAYHMFYLLLPSLDDRTALIAHLKENGINSVFHYLPLHLSVMGRRYGGAEGDCPVTESVSDRLLRLPFYNELTEADQATVVAAIRKFKTKAR